MSDPLMQHSATCCDSLESAQNERNNAAIRKSIERTQIPIAAAIKRTRVEAIETQEPNDPSRASVRSIPDLAKLKVAMEGMEDQFDFEAHSEEDLSWKGNRVPVMSTDPFMRQMSTPARFTNTSPMSGLKGKEASGSPLLRDVVKIFTVFGLTRQCTEDLLAQELTDGGFRHIRDYNFLHVPRTLFGEAIGFFFIGFEQAGVGNAFKAAYQGRVLHSVSHGMALEIRHTTPEDVRYARLAISGTMNVKMGSASQNSHLQQQHGFCRVCGKILQSKNPHRLFRFCPHCGAETQSVM